MDSDDDDDDEESNDSCDGYSYSANASRKPPVITTTAPEVVST